MIRSGDVTLDGNGHTITGDEGDVFVGTAIPFTRTAEPLPNVTVRNVVSNTDVELYRAPGATVRNVTAQRIDLSDSDGGVVANSTLQSTARRTAVIDVFRSNGTVVANNTVRSDADPDSYYRYPESGSVDVWVSENVTVRDNVVRSNATGFDVYEVTNSTFVNNTAVGREGRGLAVTDGSRDNVFEGTDVSDSAVGVFVSGSAGNVFRDTTATNTSDAVLDARDGGPNQFDGLRTGPNTTASVTGRNLVVRSVDAPPAVPSGLAAVGGFVEVVRYRGSEVSLGVGYDESAVDAAGLSESDLRLYRYPAEEAPNHVYAPMGSTTETVEIDDWQPLPESEANATTNVVSVDVREFDFGDSDSPTDATPIDVNETVSGTLVSDESDWYAFEAEAGEAILPTLNLVGPLESRAIQLSIVGPDGTPVGASPADLIHGDDYEAGTEWPAQGRQARGAATAEASGTYYVRVFAGKTNAQLEPGAYNLTVETRELDPFDPNQRRETATSVETGERVTGTAGAYDEDWFSFRADAGERITVEAGMGDYPLAVSVYGPGGELLAETEYAGPLRPENVTANRTGRYYVQFHQSNDNWQLFDLWPYSLTVRTTGDDTVADADGDGLTDREAADVHGTTPTVTDTDGDGWSDRSEANRDCDPLDPLSHP